jgi:hypothetical protein
MEFAGTTQLAVVAETVPVPNDMNWLVPLVTTVIRLAVIAVLTLAAPVCSVVNFGVALLLA